MRARPTNSVSSSPAVEPAPGPTGGVTDVPGESSMPDNPPEGPSGPGEPSPGPAARELLTRGLLANADPVLVIQGGDGLLVNLNDEAERVFGRSRGDLLGEPLARLFPPQRHDQLAELVQRCRRGESIRGVECARLGPEEGASPVALTLVPLWSAGEDPDGIAVVVREMSELRQAEARLRRMTKVFQDSASPICIQDLQGRILDWNAAAEQLLGWSREELLGTRRTLLSPEWHALADEVSRRLESGEAVRNIEFAIRSKHGKEIPVLATGSRLTDEGGEPIATCIIAQDISELKRVKADLERSNEDLRQFAATLAHDLQAPLTGVHGYCNVLDAQYRDRLDAEGREYLRYIVGSVDRMAQLIRDLLRYSHLDLQPIGLAMTDANRVIRHVVADLRTSIASAGATVTHAPLPTVEVDESQLRQLFQNLIENALKYRGEQPPCIHVSARRDEGAWAFSVRDNGRGLAPGDRERVFRLFTRLAPDEEKAGFGLGLAICRRVVERHGGRIWVESQPGAGSTFTFTLPDPG
jgi:PAS domain S-box-containing protein